MGGVGDDAGLRPRERDGVVPEVVDRHRHERAGDALAGREQHVELARVRPRRDLVGESNQRVGRLAHCRHRAHDLGTALLRSDDPLCDVLHLLGIGDGRAAELHHHPRGLCGLDHGGHYGLHRMRHAVLGAGGIGGFIGGALARAGSDVTLVLRGETLARYDGRLFVDSALLGGFEISVPAVEQLDAAADVVWVATKATHLEQAVAQLEPDGAAVVPLLNGVDHVPYLRSRYEKVVAAVIRIESERVATGRIVQSSPFARVDVVGFDALVEELSRAGLDARLRTDELTMLWEKLVFLAPLALATTALAAPLGEAREDDRLWAALDEAFTVAAAEGATIDDEAIRDFVRSLPGDMRTSMQKDVEAGREPELDAIAGPIQRGGGRHDLPVLATDSLAEAVRAKAGLS
jgi:2-dehydropantoate 2-reductase